MSASGIAAPTRWLDSLRQDSRLVIAAVVGLILALLMLPPLWILIQDSLTTTDAIGSVTGWTFAHFRKLVTDRDSLRSVWNTLLFASGSTVLSLMSGGVLAWLVERTNAP